MSHELEIVDGKASMAYAGETPWHGLGIEVEDNLTPQQFQKAANLDWTVKKVPAFVNFKGEPVDTGTHALVRETDGKVLDMVSGNWNPVQNTEAFKFFDQFVQNGDMKMHTAGALNDGKIVWALAKLNDGFSLFNGDDVEGFLLFTNPHKYGRSVDVRFTPIRVVCNNTLTLALGSQKDGVVKINHRNAFDPQLVTNTLSLTHEQMMTFKEAAEFLGRKRYDDEMLHNYLRKVFPNNSKESKELSRPAATALSVMETQPGAEYAEGTMWTALNAVTYTTDHLLGRNDDSRLRSAWYGINANRKKVALQTALEMAG